MPAKPEQVDTRSKAHVENHAINFAPISILEEIQRGGWNPRTTPVGHGKVKPSQDLPGSRGAGDYYTPKEHN